MPSKKQKLQNQKKKRGGGQQEKTHVQRTWAISSFTPQISPYPIFSLFWAELFGGSKEKTLKPHHFFPLSPSQPNIIQKVFPHFLSFFFPYPH